jgi:hypothetical protein
MLLRFYLIDKRLVFNWDQEQFSNQIYDIIVNHKLTLLGPRVNNDLGFFLSPYFTYLLVPFYFFLNLSPSALILFLIIFNIFFFFLTYLIISKLFSKEHSLWFLALWSFNSVLQVFDITAWWPIFIPIGVIITLFIFKKIQTEPKKIYNWIFLGLCIGFFTNMHIQFFSLLIISLFFIILERKKIFFIKGIFLMLLSFCFTFVPIFIFDLRHNFLNIKALIPFISGNTTSLSGISTSWFPVFSNFMYPLIFTKNIWIIFFILLLISIGLIKTKQKNSFNKNVNYLTIFALLYTFLIFSLYNKWPSEYYFVYLIPFIIFSIIDFFISNKKSYLLWIYLLIFIIFNFPILKSNLEPEYNSLNMKEKIVKELKSKVNNSKIKVSFYGRSDIDNGFNYLLRLYKLNISNDNNIPLIEIGIPPKKNSIQIGEYGVFIPNSLKK